MQIDKWDGHNAYTPRCNFEWNASNYAILPRGNNRQVFTAWTIIPRHDLEAYQQMRECLISREAPNVRDFDVHMMDSALNHFALSSNAWRTSRASARRTRGFLPKGNVVVRIDFVFFNGKASVFNVKEA